MNRRQQIRQQRFDYHMTVGLDIAEHRHHRMALVSGWSQHLPGIRQMWQCIRCGQRLFVDLTHQNRYSARHGLALHFDCQRREK